MGELEKLQDEVRFLRSVREGQKFIIRKVDAEKADLQCRVDWLTEKLYRYAEEMLSRDELIAKLGDDNGQYAQKLFDAAGHITAAKNPTLHGMTFAGEIYQIISQKHFPTERYKMKEYMRLHDEESRIGLAATVKARKG